VAGALIALLIGCRGCQEESPEPSLAEVSEEIQFAAIDQLGPHHLLSTIERTDARDGELLSETTESVEIRWQDWDHFEIRRVVDGRLVSATRVSDGRAWVLRGNDDLWRRRDDAEPYRVQLRQTWNTWDQALELFGERVVLTEAGEAVVESRPARKFAVSLSPPLQVGPRRARRLAQDGQPVELGGWLWLDEATAVRLKAEVSGVHEQGARRREVALNLTRGAIGQWQEVSPPSPDEVREP